MKRACVFFSLILLLLTAGCAARRGIVFFAEEYWWNVLTAESDYQAMLGGLAAQHDYSLAVIVAPKNTNYLEYLKKGMLEKPSDIVITGPLVSTEAILLAGQFPDKKFAILAAPRLDTAIRRTSSPSGIAGGRPFLRPAALRDRHSQKIKCSAAGSASF